MVRRILVGAALVLAAGTANAGDISEDLARAYELAYNLDHEAAVDLFEAAIAADPNNPATHRGLAAMTWMRVLFLRGTMTVDDYLGGVSPKNVALPEPPAELAAAFHEHATTAVALSEAMVKANPDNADAHYQLGASLGLAASYRATVKGETIGALKPARAAYAAHERVLQLDPTRKDAMLVVGTYRYLVSTLPLPIRMMARMVGFGGGKEEGLRLIREAATYDGETRTEAAFGLVLLYNREKDYEEAQHVLRDLKRRYPRNRVVWLESAATALRDARPALAASSLREGFSMLEADGGGCGCQVKRRCGATCAVRPDSNSNVTPRRAETSWPYSIWTRDSGSPDGPISNSASSLTSPATSTRLADTTARRVTSAPKDETNGVRTLPNAWRRTATAASRTVCVRGLGTPRVPSLSEPRKRGPGSPGSSR